MAKRRALPSRAAAAAFAASLMLPLPALAQADQPAGAASVAKPQAKKHQQTAGAAKEAVGAPLDLSAFATNTALSAPPAPAAPAAPQASASEPEDELCPNGRNSYIPPCMGTFPQADPTYHGPAGR